MAATCRSAPRSSWSCAGTRSSGACPCTGSRRELSRVGARSRSRARSSGSALMSWNRVAVAGAGLIKFGELFDQSYEQMAAGAFQAAVANVDRGIEPDQIDAVFVATQRGTLWGQEGIGGNTLPTALGVPGAPCPRIPN